MHKKKIIGISGSLKKGSVNTILLEQMKQWTDEHVSFELYTGIGDLPYFNPDHDHEHSPGVVVLFREALKQADGVVISTPEFARGVPGVLKNALDWIVSSGEFVHKPVVTISASTMPTAGRDAHESLLKTLKMITALIPEGGSLSVPMIRTKMNISGKITDALLVNDLEALWRKLLTAIDHPVSPYH